MDECRKKKTQSTYTDELLKEITGLRAANRELKVQVKQIKNEADMAVRELSMTMDLILCEVLMKYGTVIHDVAQIPEDGEVIGWHLDIPAPSIEHLKGKQVKVQQKKEEGLYSIGLVILPPEKKEEAKDE